MWRCLWILVVSACIEPGSVTCPNGLVCPAGYDCAIVSSNDACVTADQIAACNDLPDLAECDTTDNRKHCIDGVCIALCGDGRLDPGETCDDGNLDENDGCSSLCNEEVCGNAIVDIVRGEACDEGVPGLSGDGCSSFCRVENGSWIDITPVPITARQGIALAYDEDRQQLVAFGGSSHGGVLADTWIWLPGPSYWRRIVPAKSPPPRRFHSMSYDSDRKRIVMFGGFGTLGVLDDTWEWDGISWTERVPATSPPPRFGTQITYDRVRKKTVLFGGHIESPLDDTWVWDGTTWTELHPTVHPTGNFYPQLGWDSTSQRVIYCGVGSGTPSTWSWNGTTWIDLGVACPVGSLVQNNRLAADATQLVLFVGDDTKVYTWSGTAWVAHTIPGPPPRADAGFGYDGSDMIMFGGEDLDGVDLGDTWRLALGSSEWVEYAAGVDAPTGVELPEVASDPLSGRTIFFGGVVGIRNTITFFWDRQGWISEPAALLARLDGAMAFDIARKKSVLFGGYGYNPDTLENLAQTWELTGRIWADRTATLTPSPSKRRGTRMAYDAARQTMILFGGNDGTTLHGDTWSFDGASWALLSPPTSPSPRTQHSMAYDPVRERIVLFGGVDSLTSLAQDTWEWNGTTWTEMPSATSPAKRSGAGMVYDPLRRVIVLVGGSDRPIDYATYGDWWEWDGTTWIKAGEDDRIARRGHGMFYDADRGGIVVFGGLRNAFDTTPIADQWILQYHSGFPREVCGIDGEDLDGDGRGGCQDPDCWARCAPLCLPGASCPSTAPSCGDGTCEPAVEDYLLCPGDCPQP